MASSIWRGDDRVEVEGRPVPRAPHEIREFGQGDFNVESLVVTIERSIELVRAMERG